MVTYAVGTGRVDSEAQAAYVSKVPVPVYPELFCW